MAVTDTSVVCVPVCLQRDVEKCFVDMGYLFPAYHQFYWMGLQTNVLGSKWPNFTWL